MHINGGAGIDRAQYTDSPVGLTVDLQIPANNTSFAFGDSYISIENLYGSKFDDSLRGDAGANTIWGGAGNDRCIGGDGNDMLIGGAGADVQRRVRHRPRPVHRCAGWPDRRSANPGQQHRFRRRRHLYLDREPVRLELQRRSARECRRQHRPGRNRQRSSAWPRRQ